MKPLTQPRAGCSKGIAGRGARQLVVRDRAGRLLADGVDRIDAASGTFQRGEALVQISIQFLGSRRVRGLLLLVQGPLLFGAVNLAEVVYTHIHLRRGAGFDEVGNRNSGHQADNRNEREAEVTGDQSAQGQAFAGKRARRPPDSLVPTLAGEPSRVIAYRWPANGGARFERTEMAVGRGEVIAAALAILDEPPNVDETTDVLVCTHGTRDRCCGSLG